MIKIMKASAGSGKTFNLAKTYIRLILSQEDRYAYRHILAVTFTNKATEGMKSRILKELHVLATDTASSDYAEDFIPLCGSAEALAQKAGSVLCDILHDYSAFAVSTIDRFFQQTLKAFSREIGQFASYQVELDKESLVNESVDRVLDTLSEDRPELLKWLTQSVLEDLEQGNRYNLENNLRTVAQTLTSDEHRAAVEEYAIDEDDAYSKERLKDVKSALRKTVQDFRKAVSDAAKAFTDGCAGEGIGNSDFSGTSFNAMYKYAVMGPKDDLKVPSDTVFKRSTDYPLWFRKGDRERFSGSEGALLPLLQSFCSLFRDENGASLRYRVYLTAQKISGQLSELGIAGDLQRELKALMKEKNVLSLDDSNVILRNIIDGSDAPFIYEKLGVRFENFLLDEFQDTSRIQWDNFLPLVKESNAGGHENLLVGDVKQSIYRWRGSDWQMMASGVQKDFDQIVEEPLKCNFRSLGNIVDFNNGFFKYAADAIDSMSPVKEGGASVSDIYADVCQEIKAKESENGYVEAVFCSEEQELEHILSTIEKVRSAGAKLGDITVLVRDNRHGSTVALYLMEHGISVISDDTLHLKSSSVVRQAVSLLSTAGNAEDSIGSFLAGELDIDVAGIEYISLLDLCEKIFRKLRSHNEEQFDLQTQYVQSFMDYVQDYASLNGNSIDGFLKTWNDADPRISSPSDSESVMVMTIHKSKGLEFPYVIFPYAEKTTLFKSDKHWAKPSVEGTSISDVAGGIFHVQLSDPKSDQSLFCSESAREMHLQHIDNINTFYVALTRAVKGMTVISVLPPDECQTAVDGGSAYDFKDFSQILYAFLQSRGEASGFMRKEEDGCIFFERGKIYDFASMERKESDASELVPGYPSFPLNPEPGDGSVDVRERGRLKFSADSIDFFCDEARASASARLNGTVLHAILAQVRIPSDLQPAIELAVASGDLSQEDAPACMDMLSKGISSHPSWFQDDESEIFSETSLIDTDGKEKRPDRVILHDGKVTIIDYKFGEKNPKYHSQVARYADIYRRMGYQVQQAAIWYVKTDEVE